MTRHSKILHRNDGLSLVEMSVVLAIIGLLIGGIMGGQALMRASAVKSVLVDFQRYQQAAISFQNKYLALPGDMTNATGYWGTAAAGVSCVTTAGTAPATCNGNGDGKIQLSTNSNENFRFWQQLSNAGLITGSYNGIAAGGNSYATSAANAPVGKIDNSVWFAGWPGGCGNNGAMFCNITYNNEIDFGGIVSNNYPSAGILTGAEAYGIDLKLDDGKPGMGKVIANWSSCTPAANANANTVDYSLISSAQSCNLAFARAFGRGYH